MTETIITIGIIIAILYLYKMLSGGELAKQEYEKEKNKFILNPDKFSGFGAVTTLETEFKIIEIFFSDKDDLAKKLNELTRKRMLLMQCLETTYSEAAKSPIATVLVKVDKPLPPYTREENTNEPEKGND